MLAADPDNVIFDSAVTPLEQTQILVHHGVTTDYRHGRRHSMTVAVEIESAHALVGVAG